MNTPDAAGAVMVDVMFDILVVAVLCMREYQKASIRLLETGFFVSPVLRTNQIALLETYLVSADTGNPLIAISSREFLTSYCSSFVVRNTY